MKKISYITLILICCISLVNPCVVSAFETYLREFEHENYTEAYYGVDDEYVKVILEGTGNVERPVWYDIVTEVIIEDGISEIGNYFMGDSENLQSIMLPLSVEKISNRAFSNCINLKNVELPISITEIGDMAFMQSGIEEIYVPDNVTEIGIGAFSACTNLEKIIVSDNNLFFDDLDGVLTDKNNRILLSYPSGKQAESYSIPETISEISEGAFVILDSDNLKFITIPKTVSLINDNAIITENGIKDLKESLTICSYKNTAAESYAFENGFKFIALDEPEPPSETTITTTNLPNVTISTETTTTTNLSNVTTSTETTTTTSSSETISTDNSGNTISTVTTNVTDKNTSSSETTKVVGVSQDKTTETSITTKSADSPKTGDSGVTEAILLLVVTVSIAFFLRKKQNTNF